MGNTQIRLRYFDARGRAQFLRAYMNVRGVPFEDDRVPLEPDFASWIAVREDRSINGPLKRLPVLRYGNQVIPETFVIAGFIHEQFGDAAVLSEEENRQHEVIVSSAYTDLMLNIGTLIWSDLMYKGVDLGSFVRLNLDRLNRVLTVLDQTIAEWDWVGRMHERPATVADCLLWEELDQAISTFGSHLTLEDKPALARFRSEHPSRNEFERLLAESPCQITGRPGEADAISNIQAILSKDVIAS